jgi:hypothetical protein
MQSRDHLERQWPLAIQDFVNPVDLADHRHEVLGAFFFGEVLTDGYVTATVILPARRERGAGLTTISMSRSIVSRQP